MKLFNSRRKKVLLTFAATALAAVAGTVFATALGDATGDSRGKIGELQTVTFQAGPAGQGILPGENGDASIHATNPNQQSQWVVAVADTQTDWTLEGSPAGNLNGYLSVNAGTVAQPIEIPPGTNDVVLPDVFHAGANLPLAEYQGRTFVKPLRVSLASTAGG